MEGRQSRASHTIEGLEPDTHYCFKANVRRGGRRFEVPGKVCGRTKDAPATASGLKSRTLILSRGIPHEGWMSFQGGLGLRGSEYTSFEVTTQGVVAHFIKRRADGTFPSVDDACTKSGSYVRMLSGERGSDDEFKELFGNSSPPTDFSTVFVACVPANVRDLAGGLAVRVEYK